MTTDMGEAGEAEGTDTEEMAAKKAQERAKEAKKGKDKPSSKSPPGLTLVRGSKALVLADGKTRANGDAMRRAAKHLGVTVPKTRSASSDAELLGALRMEISKRLAKLAETDHVVCARCKEIATDDTEFCPYCGDEGEDSKAEIVEASPVGISRASQAPVPQRAEEALDERLRRIVELKKSAVGLSYDIGIELKAIRDQQLFRARGYQDFKSFAVKELPFTRESAQQLIRIVEQHSREEYTTIGYAKLREIAAVTEPTAKAQLVEEARKGATVGQIKERAASLTGKVAPATTSSGSRPAPSPEKGEKITLLGKVGARSQVLKFHNVETGEVLDHAGVFKTYMPNSYGELEIADGVFLRVGLRTSADNKLEGLTVRFVRSEEDAE
jgi:hypothetical protein